MTTAGSLLGSPSPTRRRSSPFTSPSTLNKTTPVRGRRVVHYLRNHGPSEGGEQARLSVLEKDERIRQLASSRLQVAALMALVMENFGDHPHRGRTAFQAGKSTQKGMHAAHANLLPHLRDRKKQSIISRAAKKILSAEDHKILQAKGASHQDLDRLRSPSITKSEAHKIINRFWSRNSLLGGSWFERNHMNVTYQVSRLINLCVDKRIEAEFRPRLQAWMQQVSKKELTAKEMMQQFVPALRAFLSKCERATKEKLQQLQTYRSQMAAGLACCRALQEKAEPWTKKDLKSLETQLSRWHRAKKLVKQPKEHAAGVSGLKSFRYFGPLTSLPRRLVSIAPQNRESVVRRVFAQYEHLDLPDLVEREVAKHTTRLSEIETGFRLEREGSLFHDEDWEQLCSGGTEQALSLIQKRTPGRDITNRARLREGGVIPFPQL